jgi:hypothetical protein
LEKNEKIGKLLSGRPVVPFSIQSDSPKL